MSYSEDIFSFFSLHESDRCYYTFWWECFLMMDLRQCMLTRRRLQASIELSDLSSKLSKSIKKSALLMTYHDTLDFIVRSSKSPLRKILIILCNELSNRTKDRFDYKSYGEDIFTDCIFSIISSPELKIKLKSCENEDTKIYSTIVIHLSFSLYRPQMQIF